jgi:glycosyltransferase involved in cell wall biosynthesis
MIYIVDIEAVETRYTGQWKTHIPTLLRQKGYDVTVIEGPTDIPAATTPGAFLNFGGTNVYKSAQVEQLGRLFCAGSIKSGDHFVFTDAWHPGIINLKYMSELLGIPVKIHALWHAGSYDPADFLGRLIGDAPWVRHAEKSFFHAIDHNYFATQFHIQMFLTNLFGETRDSRQDYLPTKKIVRTGWPMEYMPMTLYPYKHFIKRNLILFPHRIAPEKQVEIFRDLAQQMPEYEFVVCQDQQLTKDEYHRLLAESKIVFSCSLQETLGIGCYEGAILGSIPLVPDRLSYSEMYDNEFKYPSEWTENWDSYIAHRSELVEHVRNLMQNQEDIVGHVYQQAQSLTSNFFSAQALLDNLRG